MTRLAEIEGHIASMDGMLDIVGAMRSLAGMRMQEALRALPAARRYGAALLSGVADSLALLVSADGALPPAQGATAYILCTSEHGFVGGFNETLYEAARKQLARGDVLFVLGSRGAALAAERGLKVAWSDAMASRSGAVPQLVVRLTGALFRHLAAGGARRVVVIYMGYRQGAAAQLEQRVLLPLDRTLVGAAGPPRAPLHNLAPRALHERLLAEYVFAALSEAVIESLVSENAARLTAMESAHDNVSKKLDRLRQQGRLERQSEITSELIELVTGAEASRKEPRGITHQDS